MLQETQLSLTKRATHLRKRNDVFSGGAKFFFCRGGARYL